MKLHHFARSVLSITAVAWGIPLAQAQEGQDVRVSAANTKFTQLDLDHDGFLSKDEVRNIEGHAKFFGEADENRDGRLDPSEFLKFQSLQDRAYVGRVTDDSVITAKVKAALLKEQQLKALDVSVETYRGEVLLSGFVQDDSQRKKAVQVASAVSGVTKVKDGLAVR